jgi:hypothetical protein
LDSLAAENRRKDEARKKSEYRRDISELQNEGKYVASYLLGRSRKF